MQIKLIELFGGIGTQAMAMKAAGIDFQSVCLVENDEKTVQVYNKIHNTDYKALDICKIQASDLNIKDDDSLYIMTYSYPCTSLSTIGTRAGMAEGSGTASSLIWQVKRLLSDCDYLPDILVMENVTQCHNKNNMPDFIAWFRFLQSIGYTSYYSDLNAYNFGLPQGRVRTFAVSVLKDRFKTTEYNFFKNDMLIDKDNISFTTYLEDYFRYPYIISNYTVRERAKYLYDNFIKTKKVPVMGYKVGSNIVINKVIDGYNCSIKKDGCVPTITAHANAAATHCGTAVILYITSNNELEMRRLAPLECWKLQGYTEKDFRYAQEVYDSDTFLYKLAGNAIALPVIEQIFLHIDRFIKENRIGVTDEMIEYLQIELDIAGQYMTANDLSSYVESFVRNDLKRAPASACHLQIVDKEFKSRAEAIKYAQQLNTMLALHSANVCISYMNKPMPQKDFLRLERCIYKNKLLLADILCGAALRKLPEYKVQCDCGNTISSHSFDNNMPSVIATNMINDRILCPCCKRDITALFYKPDYLKDIQRKFRNVLNSEAELKGCHNIEIEGNALRKYWFISIEYPVVAN